MSEYVMVTDWELVDKDDFYLSDEWMANTSAETMKQAKALQAEGNLYAAYVVPASDYVIYHRMDAHQIFIDEDGNEIMSCESEIIGGKHKESFEYSY